jgi:hypothetical protein
LEYRTHKTPELIGNGQTRTEFGISPQQYFDAGEWRDIIPEIKSLEATQSFFQLSLPENSAGDIEIVCDDSGMVLRPYCLGLVDAEQLNPSTVRYRDAWGKGVHLDITINKCGVRKEIVIDNIELFERDLVFDFEIISSGKNKLAFSGKELGSMSAIESVLTAAPIGDGRMCIRPASAWMKEQKNIPVLMEILKGDTQSILRKTLLAKDFAGLKGKLTTDATFAGYSASGDGIIDHQHATWATLRAAATGSSTNTIAGTETLRTRLRSGDYYIGRMMFPFDTALVPANASMVAAGCTFRLTLAPNTDYNAGGAPKLSLVASTATSIATNQFANFGSTKLSTDFAGGASKSTESAALNDDGMAAITKAGTTRFGLRETYHDLANSAPTVEDPSTGRGFDVYCSDANGVGDDPLLSLTYTAGSVIRNGGGVRSRTIYNRRQNRVNSI